MASKTGCVLIEHKGHSAPEALIDKIRANNKSVMGFAIPVEGSNELMIDTIKEMPNPKEWADLRSGMNDFPLLSWWGNAKEGFQDKDIQPFVLLSNDHGRPCLVMAAEGDFTPHAKPKESLSDEYRLYQACVPMVEDINRTCDGDMSKIMTSIKGSLFKGWLGSQSLTRGYVVFMSGTGVVVIHEKGNDKGTRNDAFEVSDAYGYKASAPLQGGATTAAAKIAQIKAQRAGTSSSASAVVSATTSPDKLKQTSAEATVEAARAVLTGGKVMRSGTAVATGVVPVPEEKEEPDDVGTQIEHAPGESVEGYEYPPKELALGGRKNAKNFGRLVGWYLRHNGGVLPLENKVVLRSMWEKGEALPGVKAGQEPWQHPHEKAAEERKAVQETIKSFRDPKLQNAVKGGTQHIIPATPADVEKIARTANDPFISQARKDKIMEGFVGRDTVLKAISYEEAEVFSPSELNKLDRPTADPLTAFDGVIKDYTGWRWSRDDTAELCVIDPQFCSQVIHDLVYRYNLAQLQAKGAIKEEVPPTTGGTKLVGPAAVALRLLKRA